MEKEWRADAHQYGQVPSADEESWNTLAVTERRGEAWSTAHRRPKSEKARPSKVQSITDAKFPVYRSNR